MSFWQTERCSNSISLDPVTEHQVELEIRKLNEHELCGHDEIPAKLVEKIWKYVMKPLMYIYNQSF